MTYAVLSKTLQPGQTLTTEELDIIQKFGDATAEFHIKETEEIMRQYPGLSEGGAMDVSYLRTRSRHTRKLEARLVQEHLAGKTVMISDWPDHADGNYDPYSGEPLP